MAPWVGPAFLLLGAVTVPWAIVLAVTLPRTAQAGHYRLAWGGFDLGLAAALLGTGWIAVHGSDRVELPAMAAATMLIVDAWFDATTSSDTAGLVTALVMAVVVELPLAVLCLWIAWHDDEIREQRLRFLPRAASGRPEGLMSRARRAFRRRSQ